MGRLKHLFIVVYVIIGLFVAWDRGYATMSWLKTLASAVLAVGPRPPAATPRPEAR